MLITKTENKIFYFISFFTAILFGFVGVLILFVLGVIYFCGKRYLQSRGSVSELPQFALRKKHHDQRKPN